MKLNGGGSVINEAYPVKFHNGALQRDVKFFSSFKNKLNFGGKMLVSFIV